MAIDLFCGLGGWSEGFLAEGYRCIGFDTERHDYGSGGYPGQLVLQDVLTLHGSQFKDAAVIVASPPCQEFSYMAMPWSRAKQIAQALRGETIEIENGPAIPVPFPDGYTGSRTLPDLTALFDACFRIQREASAAAGHHIPLVVENVKGAQPWVGPAKAHFGSFYLWGDVGMAGGAVVAGPLRIGEYCAPQRAVKVPSESGRRTTPGNGVRFTTRDCGMEGTKQMSGLRGLSHPGGKGKRDLGGPNDPRRFSSKSDSRKAASAQIAKIPFALSSYIARAFKPLERAA